ncbi:MAG: glycerol kinase, partial [Planctomycetaceae bacterium]|nr:glycerol kinase [Planctomycetaceae bacterium]
ILGMTRGSTSAHIARAALEGIAFTVYDVLQSMKEDSGIAISEVRVDGGAAASDLLMQIQADLLNVEVLRPTLLETTAFGAAGMAALAAGLLAGPESMGEHWNLDRKFEPDMDSDNRERMLKQWQQGISRARCWAGEEGNSDES